MSRYRLHLVLDVNDEELAAHIADEHDNPPYDSDPLNWDGSDIFAAADQDIVDPRECFIEYGEKVPS